MSKGCGVEVDMCNTQPRRLWVKGRGVRGVVAKREGLETLVPQVYETNGS